MFSGHMKNFALLIFLLLNPYLLGASRVGVSVRDSQGKEVLSYGESYALIIGVSEYEDQRWPDLPGVLKDVEEVSRVLREHGFEIHQVLNPTIDELEDAYSDFITQYGLDEKNRLFFWYAGHGYSHKPRGRSDYQGYLVPSNAPAPEGKLRGFKRNALSMARMQEYALDIVAKHALFLFDSCFSGSLFNLLNRAVPASISEKTAKSVRQFITAGKENETVPDKSIFKRQFLAALGGEADGNRDGYVTGTELGMFLQDRVINYSNKSQHPQYGKIRNPDLDKGDFVFELPKQKKKHLYQDSKPVKLPPAIDYAAFYKNLSDLESKIREGNVRKDMEILSQAQANYNRLRSTKGANMTLLARVGKDLEESFGRLYEYEREEREKERAAKQKSERQTKIDALLKKVRKLPASQYRENLEGYQQLLRLDPDNQRFKNKVVHYKKKLEQSNSSSRPPHVIPDPDPESRNPTTYTNSIGMELVLIPSGSFQMGWPSSESGRYKNEGPAHTVRITKPFYLGKYEVTQGQWEDVMGSNPSRFKNCGRNCPVKSVSWNDAQEFIKKLNQREGCANHHVIPDSDPGSRKNFELREGCYRLPTEAEWEYTARAGTTTKYHWGNDFDCSKVMAGNSSSWDSSCKGYVKQRGLTFDSTAPVGSYPPNQFGLYDMSGNVWEWVLDWFDSGYYKKSPGADPLNTSAASTRVLRGGGWYSGPGRVRSAIRGRVSPGARSSNLGFRLLRVASP
jgi:formylglycine-generating enzyme required for sulfatase activity